MHHADIHGFNVHFAHRLDNRRWAMLIRPRVGLIPSKAASTPDDHLVWHWSAHNRRIVGDRQRTVAEGGVEHLVLAAFTFQSTR